MLTATSAVGAALAATASGTPSTSNSDARRCGAESVHAVVAGRHRCLKYGSACRARRNAAYHRYVFHCARGYLEFWWEGLLRRPLRIPSIAPGTACPATKASGTLRQRGNFDAPSAPAFGPGPAYPTLSEEDGRAVLRYLPGWGYEGWDGTKVLWTVPRYYGPYIVRGRQLDGPNELRLDRGPAWSRQLNEAMRFVGPQDYLNPAATFLRAPGCYAYQVDGRGFSYLIVFEARLAS